MFMELSVTRSLIDSRKMVVEKYLEKKKAYELSSVSEIFVLCVADMGGKLHKFA